MEVIGKLHFTRLIRISSSTSWPSSWFALNRNVKDVFITIKSWHDCLQKHCFEVPWFLHECELQLGTHRAYMYSSVQHQPSYGLPVATTRAGAEAEEHVRHPLGQGSSKTRRRKLKLIVQFVRDTNRHRRVQALLPSSRSLLRLYLLAILSNV
jgi:hypothetical protein